MLYLRSTNRDQEVINNEPVRHDAIGDQAIAGVRDD